MRRRSLRLRPHVATWAAALFSSLAGPLLASRPALAHRDTFNGAFGAASGSLAEGAVNGQYGFSPDSPFYVSGELVRGAFTEDPRDDYNRFGGELGYESSHLGFSLRYSAIHSPTVAFSASVAGGTLLYRFARWGRLSPEEMMFLGREEREARRKKHQDETNEDVPRAPLLALSVDGITLATKSSRFGGAAATRLGAWVRARLKPCWAAYPLIDFTSWDVDPARDPGASAAYGSRALRLVRLGPQGAFHSGIRGMPGLTMQLYNELRLFPLLGLNFAATRASLEAPAGSAYSGWVSFDRYLDEKRAWALSPAYEHVYQGGKTYSFFTLALRFGTGAYFTPKETD